MKWKHDGGNHNLVVKNVRCDLKHNLSKKLSPIMKMISIFQTSNTNNNINHKSDNRVWNAHLKIYSNYKLLALIF